MSASAAQIVLRSEGTVRKFLVDIDEDETISTLKTKLHKRSGVKAPLMKIIFCGQNLSDNTPMKSLLLSPQTSLTVIAKRQDELALNSLEDIVHVNAENIPNETLNCTYNSFYLFCKKCDGMRRGKLRAYCSDCNSSSVFFYNEPRGWDDVIGYKKLKVDCKGCEFGQTASVVFKCVECGESAIPLTQVRSNVDGKLKCVVCDDNEFLQCVMLDCAHASCISCFISYCEQMHAQRNFVVKPNVGFTISCPVYMCTGYLTDVHHFYLMGVDAYKRFQHQAAELFVAQQTESQRCPWPQCNATFFLSDEGRKDDEDQNNEAMVLCPECNRIFCRYCLECDKCKCHEKVVDASLQTIQQTSKACPRCRAPTERNGGCAHIHCTQCAHQWCFVCGAQWSDECQWDHWFA